VKLWQAHVGAGLYVGLQLFNLRRKDFVTTTNIFKKMPVDWYCIFITGTFNAFSRYEPAKI